MYCFSVHLCDPTVVITAFFLLSSVKKQGRQNQGVGSGTGPPHFSEGSMLHYFYLSLSLTLVTRPLHFESNLINDCI